MVTEIIVAAGVGRVLLTTWDNLVWYTFQLLFLGWLLVCCFDGFIPVFVWLLVGGGGDGGGGGGLLFCFLIWLKLFYAKNRAKFRWMWFHYCFRTAQRLVNLFCPKWISREVPTERCPVLPSAWPFTIVRTTRLHARRMRSDICIGIKYTNPVLSLGRVIW